MAQDSQLNNTDFSFVDMAIVFIGLSILTLMAITPVVLWSLQPK
jgi:hypothetical protein